MNLILWCNRILRWSFLLLFILVPLILTPWNYELFEFNKMIVTYALTLVIVGTWLIKMILMRKIVLHRTPPDIPLFAFVATQLVSSLFSMDPHVSWFGYYSRFNGGMFSILSYIFLYYAFVSNFGAKDNDEVAFTPRFIRILLIVGVGSGVLVALYGILERLGIDKHLWVQDVQNRVFSTLGQPNWLAAYLVALLPITFGLALPGILKKKEEGTLPLPFLVWSGVSFLFFITLLSTRSRSGLLGLAVSDGLFWIIMLFRAVDKKTILRPFAIIHVIFALTIFLNGSYIDTIDRFATLKGWTNRVSGGPPKTTPPQASTPPQVPQGPLLEYGGTESGKIRQYVWQAALTAWRATQKTFFIGTGTETFAFAFFQYKPLEHNLTSEWDFLYNKAHNEYLNYLATTGILGLGTYIFLLGIVIVWFSRTIYNAQFTMHNENKTKKNALLNIDHWSLGIDNSPLTIALFSAWVSILITNFFGFSVVIMQIFLFLFPAFLFSLTNPDGGRHIQVSFPHIAKKVAVGSMVGVLIVSTIGIFFVTFSWIADTFFALGYRQTRQGQLANAYRSLSQAIALHPGEPLYYDELSGVLSGLSVASLEVGDATSAASLAQQSLLASDRAITISPNNVNFWKTRTKIFFAFSNIDPKFTQAAIDALSKAFSLSPKDPKIAYNLAVLYGRLSQNDKAIEILKQTIAMKPNYRDAYYALYVFYSEVKQPNLAKSVLQEYLTKVDPNDRDFLEKVK